MKPQKHHPVSDGAPLQAEIGLRLRQVRLENGLSQKQIGEKIGVCGQQVQKYENDTDAVPLHRLLKLASLYAVPPEWFWGIPAQAPDVSLEVDASVIHLVRAYRQIRNPKMKQKLLHLVREMANEDGTQSP